MISGHFYAFLLKMLDTVLFMWYFTKGRYDHAEDSRCEEAGNLLGRVSLSPTEEKSFDESLNLSVFREVFLSHILRM